MLAFAATAGNPVVAPDRPHNVSRRCHVGVSEELVTSFLCDLFKFQDVNNKGEIL
jgi:hypothetical protein